MAEQETVRQLATLQANVVQSQVDVTEIKGDVKSIKSTVEAVVLSQSKMDSVFVTQAQYTADKSRNWVTHTLSGLLGAILTGMVSLIVVMLSSGGKL